jgi:hypothetical protein
MLSCYSNFNCDDDVASKHGDDVDQMMMWTSHEWC